MANDIRLEADVIVIGGGTAGCVAAIKAKESLPDGTVILLEKAECQAQRGDRIGNGRRK